MPVVLLLLGFPIFLVLLAAVTSALVFFMNVPLAVLHQNLFGAIDAFALLAVPFFIYAGELMGRGSVAQRIVDFVQAGIGRVPGQPRRDHRRHLRDLRRHLRRQRRHGGDRRQGDASRDAPRRLSGDFLRRPHYRGGRDRHHHPAQSIPMIVYGTAAEESVPRLYAAGVCPG